LGNWHEKGRLRLLDCGLSQNRADFDVELDFAIGRKSNCVGHLQIRIIFNLDSFVVRVKVDNVELADLWNGTLVDELSALVV